MRADAVRNRTAILNAARILISVDGPEVGMDEIAAAAGVAVGTLYRHFPTKTDLVGAVMSETSARIVARLEAATERVAAGEAAAIAELADLFGYVGVEGAHDRMLREVAAGMGAYRPVALEIPARRLLSSLVDAAHANGSLRADVTVDDLAMLMASMPGPEVPDGARERWVALVWRGLVSR